MMNGYEKIRRILTTRLGSRPSNPTYGTRLYLLRDRKVDPETSLLYTKYAHEDITRSDPTLQVLSARLISIDKNKVFGNIQLTSGETYEVEAVA